MQFKFCFSYSKSWTFAIYDVAQFSKNEIKNFIKNANSTTKHGFALNFTEKLNSKKSKHTRLFKKVIVNKNEGWSSYWLPGKKELKHACLVVIFTLNIFR